MDWIRISNSAARWMLRQKGVAVVFEFRGKELVGCRTSLRKEDINTDAGLAGSYAFSLLVPAGQLDERPEPRTDKVTCEGVEFRVLGVETDATGGFVRIHLGDEFA